MATRNLSRVQFGGVTQAPAEEVASQLAARRGRPKLATVTVRPSRLQGEVRR